MDSSNKNAETCRTKRERSNNFSSQETELLVSLVEQYKNIIENKKSDASIWQQKERAWNQIEKAFNNATDSVFRSCKHLKLKYEALKRDTRKKSKSSEGTAVSVLTPAEEKVREMIFHSTEGNTSLLDSDTLASISATTTVDVSTGKHRLASGDSNSFSDEIITTESCNVIVQIEHTNEEPLKKELCSGSESEQLHESDTVTQNVQTQKEWKQWNPKPLRSKRHHALCKSKQYKHYDVLTKEKIQLTRLQQLVSKRELEQKAIQKKLLEEELEHKKIIHHLEKQQLLLKIELLKSEINKNKAN